MINKKTQIKAVFDADLVKLLKQTGQFNEFINDYHDVVEKFNKLEYDNFKNKKFEFECFDFVPVDESKK